MWKPNGETPLDSEFVTPLNNGQTISSPAGVSGNYYLWVSASDIVDNRTVSKSEIVNLDNIPPVITLNGNSSVTIGKGSSYTDAGANVTDNVSTGLIPTLTSNLNVNVVGTYQITYNATDNAGNTATSVTRIINVVDVSAPVITINGNGTVTISLGSSYSDEGATAIDDVDGNVTSRINTSSNVNVNVAGTYQVTYSVSDNAGNQATYTRQVIVQGLTQYRYRTSSTSCSTCYDTCSSTQSASVSYSCPSGWSLSGSTCSRQTTYTVSSTFSQVYGCSGGSWYWSSQTCSGNCNSSCADGNSPFNGSESSSCPPSGTCSAGQTGSCSSHWTATCRNPMQTQSATASYSCPSGYSLSGTTCYYYYSCNPYSCNCSTTWGSWSSWALTAVTPTSTREVETRICTSYPCQAS